MDWGGNLFDARVVRYGDLIEKLKVFNSESQEISPVKRTRCAADLFDWYYKDGAGILRDRTLWLHGIDCARS